MTQHFLDKFETTDLQASTVAAIRELSDEENLRYRDAALIALLLRVFPLRTVGLPELDQQGSKENCCVLRDLQTILNHLTFLRFGDGAFARTAQESSKAALMLAAPINLDHITRFDQSLRHAHHIIFGEESVGNIIGFFQILFSGMNPEIVQNEERVIENFVKRADMWPLPTWAVSEKNSFLSLFGPQWSSSPHWSFWREWYQGFLDGKPLDWELQRRVALIPDADWEQGPQHIAAKIEEIRREFDAEQRGNASKAEKIPVPPATAQAMAKRLRANRDAIAIWATEVGQQIEATREEVRGNNQLDPDLREKILALLDDLGGRLTDLLELLPLDTALPSNEVGERGVRWLHGFKTALQKSAKEYAAPDNLAGAIIPTGIILGCTGIGSLMGMPLAGGVVGGLITGQIKPGKAANDLLNSTKPSVD